MILIAYMILNAFALECRVIEVQRSYMDYTTNEVRTVIQNELVCQEPSQEKPQPVKKCDKKTCTR